MEYVTTIRTAVAESSFRSEALWARSTRLLLGLAAVVWLALGLLGCSSSPPPDPLAPPEEKLLPWEGQTRTLFDDSIHPAAVGLSLDGRPLGSAPLLKERARAAEVVARLKVNTVTMDRVGAKTTYHLTLRVGRPPLSRPKIEVNSVELLVTPNSPAFGIVESLGTGLQGRIFIGFVRRFMGEHGPELHWHLTADTREVADAIQQAVTFDELATQ